MVDLAPPYAPTADDDAAQRPRSWRAAIIDFCRRQPLGTVGLVLVLVMAVAGLSAEWIAPYSPTSNDFAAMTEPPSWAHLMGTDQFGRDLFSRIVFGARTALIVGFSCAIVGGFAGLVLGVGERLFRRPHRPLAAARPRRGDGLPADHHGARRRRRSSAAASTT